MSHSFIDKLNENSIQKVTGWMHTQNFVFDSVTIIIQDSNGEVISKDFKRFNLDLSLKHEKELIENDIESKKRKLESIDNVIKKRQATPIQTGEYEILYQGFTWEISSEQYRGFCKTCQQNRHVEWCVHDGMTEDKICILCIKKLATIRRNILDGWERIEYDEQKHSFRECNYCDRELFKDYFNCTYHFKEIRCCQECVDLFVQKDIRIPFPPQSINEIFSVKE